MPLARYTGSPGPFASDEEDFESVSQVTGPVSIHGPTQMLAFASLGFSLFQINVSMQTCYEVKKKK